MKNTLVLSIILLLPMVIGLTNCSGAKTTLENASWVLESYGEQGNMQTVLGGAEITSLFDSTKGEISGFAGVNSYSARYQIQNSALSVEQISYEELMYSLTPGVMEQEREFLAKLVNAVTFQLDGNQLTIFSSGDKVLIFHPK